MSLTPEQIKILERHLKWQRIGYIIGFSMLGLFALLLAFEAMRQQYLLHQVIQSIK